MRGLRERHAAASPLTHVGVGFRRLRPMRAQSRRFIFRENTARSLARPPSLSPSEVFWRERCMSVGGLQTWRSCIAKEAP